MPWRASDFRASSTSHSSWVAISDVRARVEQHVERPHEARPHRLVGLEGERGRLDVDALAHAHARAQIGEGARVGDRAAQPGLQHDADVLEPGVP